MTPCWFFYVNLSWQVLRKNIIFSKLSGQGTCPETSIIYLLSFLIVGSPAAGAKKTSGLRTKEDNMQHIGGTKEDNMQHTEDKVNK